jgi:DeoR/GlpR family transcriptional regulator of sugar metabolism
MELAMVILAALTVIVSVIALCVSYHSARKGNSLSLAANELTTTANEVQKMANEMQMGQVEMQIREMISSARARYQDKVFQMTDYQDESIKNALMAAAHEDFLNAYDEACAKYLDSKVDRLRFKKLYHDEIRQLVTDSANSDKYREPQTKYHATVKVYKEWNDLEGNL